MTTTPKPQFKAHFIVRDCDGIPKFDDPENVDPEMLQGITDEDIAKMDPGIVRTLGLGHRLKEE